MQQNPLVEVAGIEWCGPILQKRNGDTQPQERCPDRPSVARHLNPYWRSHTEMCFLLSPVKGARSQSAHRSRNLIPAISAMRSSSAGHAYRNGDSTCLPRPSMTHSGVTRPVG
jgi:hypothetical protein